jgi:hypothetical protein
VSLPAADLHTGRRVAIRFKLYYASAVARLATVDFIAPPIKKSLLRTETGTQRISMRIWMRPLWDLYGLKRIVGIQKASWKATVPVPASRAKGPGVPEMVMGGYCDSSGRLCLSLLKCKTAALCDNSHTIRSLSRLTPVCCAQRTLV